MLGLIKSLLKKCRPQDSEAESVKQELTTVEHQLIALSCGSFWHWLELKEWCNKNKPELSDKFAKHFEDSDNINEIIEALKEVENEYQSSTSQAPETVEALLANHKSNKRDWSTETIDELLGLSQLMQITPYEAKMLALYFMDFLHTDHNIIIDILDEQRSGDRELRAWLRDRELIQDAIHSLERVHYERAKLAQ